MSVDLTYPQHDFFILSKTIKGWKIILKDTKDPEQEAMMEDPFLDRYFSTRDEAFHLANRYSKIKAFI